jgi:hypothetical protein
MSINPGYQAYEKFISGMYLGELTRLVLLSLVDACPHSLLFGGKGSEVMNKMWAVDSSFMSEIEEAWQGADVDVAQEGELPAEELSEDAKKRASRVREVVVKLFGYEDDQVSLRDAAVGLSLIDKHGTHILPGRSMGVVPRRASRRPAKRRSHRRRPRPNRAGRPQGIGDPNRRRPHPNWRRWLVSRLFCHDVELALMREQAGGALSAV